MTTKERLYFEDNVGNTIIHSTSGTYILIGVNCNFVYGRRPGKFEVYKLDPDYVTVLRKQNGSEAEEEFLKYLSQDCGLSYSEMIENCNSRKQKYTLPRYFHILFRRKVLGLSQKKTAILYKKDHATTIHNLKTLNDWMQTDKSIKEDYHNTITFINNLDARAFK